MLRSNLDPDEATSLPAFPASTQRALRFAACLGEAFDLAMLAVASGAILADLPCALAPAVDAGLVAQGAPGAYRFTSARAREAVHALVPARELPALHLSIGRRLADAQPADGARHLDEGARMLEVLLHDAERRLAQQEKLAALGVLAPGVAHEIKNPLTFVNNFAELSVGLAAELREEIAGLVDPVSLPRVREIVDALVNSATRIHEHGARADRVVRGMLERSHGLTGEPRETDLNALVRAYAHAARGHAREPRLDITLDGAVGCLRVVPEEIGRVVLNLVTNALYAAEAQRAARGAGFTPAVVVSTRGLGDRVEVRVRDNGAGIPAHIRDRIYTPFFTTKPRGEGTGLGLSLSRDVVVRGHHGALTFETEEGDHTEFVVVLPR